MAAFEAEPQMDPLIAHLQAFLASIGRVLRAIEIGACDGGEVRTALHRSILMDDDAGGDQELCPSLSPDYRR